MKYVKPPIELSLVDRSKVLDVGCGVGYLLPFFQDGVGLDIDIRRIKCGHQFFEKEMICADVRNIPFRSGSFNTVTCLEVIEHLEDDSDYLALVEIYRILKRGGILLLSTPFDSFLAKFSDPHFYIGRHKHYKLEVLTRMLVGIGFDVKKASFERLGLARTLLWFFIRPLEWLISFSGSCRLAKVYLFIMEYERRVVPYDIRILAVKAGNQDIAVSS